MKPDKKWTTNGLCISTASTIWNFLLYQVWLLPQPYRPFAIFQSNHLCIIFIRFRLVDCWINRESVFHETLQKLWEKEKLIAMFTYHLLQLAGRNTVEYHGHHRITVIRLILPKLRKTLRWRLHKDFTSPLI